MIRGYRESDESQIRALLAAAWPDDPVMVEISAPTPSTPRQAGQER
jgi:hypothetical protein